MLSEEALILIAAAGGLALLVLGVIELLWPSMPRHPMRRASTPLAPPPAAARPPRAAPAPVAKPVPPPASAARPEPPPAAEGAPPRKRRSKVSPHARSHARHAIAASGAAAAGPSTPPPRSAPRPDVAPAPPAPPRPPLTPSVVPQPVGAGSARPDQAEGGPSDLREGSVTPVPPAGPVPAERQLDPALVETCFALYQNRRHDEVVSIGEDALGRVRAESLVEDDAREVAALWAVVALAKQARGDDEGACAALESALAIAPEPERPTYRQHLAGLSLHAAQSLLARAGGQESETRVAELRAALVWVARGLALAPADTRLAELGTQARAALWPACEQAVNRLLQRQDFETARRLVRETLDDPHLPSELVDDFEHLLTGTFGGEIGQLTAQAIRSMQEERESEALASLRRAEELLTTIAHEALPPKRREEVDQRLWWGYTRLGVRRVEAGQYEEAVDPLVHALRFADIGPDRQAETRATLARALEGVADLRALRIRQLNDDGNRDEAVLRTEMLRELLRRCMELGLSEDELSAAFAKTRRLVAELGMEDRA